MNYEQAYALHEALVKKVENLHYKIDMLVHGGPIHGPRGDQHFQTVDSIFRACYALTFDIAVLEAELKRHQFQAAKRNKCVDYPGTENGLAEIARVHGLSTTDVRLTMHEATKILASADLLLNDLIQIKCDLTGDLFGPAASLPAGNITQIASSLLNRESQINRLQNEIDALRAECTDNPIAVDEILRVAKDLNLRG